MSLPTGKYRCVLLWAKRRQSGKGWDIEFILTDTGEREKAFVLNRDIGFVVAVGTMSLRGDRFQPRDPEGALPVVVLSLKFKPKYDMTAVSGWVTTGTFMRVDTRYTGKTFEPEEF